MDIAAKKWVREAIPEEKIGEVTPQKYFEYNYDPNKVPQGGEYEDSLRNSFTKDDDLRLFCQMMFQLLLPGRIPFKAKKIFCIGPSDSGKTTWLEPILEVLDEEKVVTCTDEGKFSTQMLEEDTQLLFIDEYSSGNRIANDIYHGLSNILSG